MNTSSTHRDPIFIRVLVFRQSGQWLAQCLERDLVAQAPSEQQAIDSFVRLLKLRLLRDSERGVEPLVNLPPAPERYEEIWNQLIADDGEELKAKSVTPDAYVISQIANNGDSGVFHP